MKFAFLWGGWGLCMVLAGCTVPSRDVVEIAEPAPVPPPGAAPEPSPMVISAPPVEATRPKALAVETMAVIRERRIPAYPTALAEEGVEGQVIAEFYVGTEGKAEDVRIERSPHPLLSKAVTDALKGWRFDPARSADGRPVRTRMRLPFRFQVE
ncbi:energy transducer TonB [Variovorax sp. ZS18.2.2]|uniref:energy transducer TonB n=1 Tax=Variovorax sp. ZS18.2.2 TaxID=2971255 RepID=UPI002150DE8C|nr:energy transducer TonB [Variovorax sp. ZS18.2.2]MCR6475446.1 energy transducer TonB [Variovorax sp. ZS18.2.2]